MAFQYDAEIMRALTKLGNEFPGLNWDFSPDNEYGGNELVSHWLGSEDEDVMLCVFRGQHLNEQFHRQDFFFLHFAYKGNYDALSSRYNNFITIQEGDCYIGQPYSGYAAKKESEEEGIIIGVLIRKETFIREFLSTFSSDTALLNFFLEPQKNKYADEFIHIKIPNFSPIWRLLGLLVLEYANRTGDTNKIIKPMIMSLCLYVSHEYKQQNLHGKTTLEDRIVAYIDANSDTVTLLSVAEHFGYHPVYISKFLPKKTGMTFSEIVTNSRMRRAGVLLHHTDLSIEKISLMLGYSNTSNFYKVFRSCFGTSPREIRQNNQIENH